MNFDNLILNDLMTGPNRFNPSLLILFFWLWQHSLDCAIEWVKEFKIYSVETVTHETEKRDHKVKRIKKNIAGQVLTYN